MEAHAWDWSRILEATAKADAAAGTTESRHTVFIKEVLARTLRISFFEFVTSAQCDIFPPEFLTLMPPEPGPVYRYSEADAPLADVAAQVRRYLKDKPDDLFDTWYKGKASDAKMSAAQKIDVFVQAMLIASTVVPDTLPDAAKPEAHAIASLFKVKRRVEACEQTIRSLIEQQDEEARARPGADSGAKRVLKNVGEFWAKNPQMIELVIDILLNAKLVDPFQLLEWIFCAENKPLFLRYSIWFILDDATTKLLSLSAIAEADLARTLSQIDAEELPPGHQLVTLAGNIRKKLAKFEKNEAKFFAKLLEHFARAISSHLEQAALQGLSGIDEWHASTVGRLQHITLKHAAKVEPILESTLKALSIADPPIYPAALITMQNQLLRSG